MIGEKAKRGGKVDMKGMMIGCVILALIAAAVYLLMGDSTIAVPTPNTGAAPALLISAAGDCYALGALMILVRKRWLWIAGLAVNTLVVAVSLIFAILNPDIMFTPPGAATIITQVLLEAGLAYLVFAHATIPQLGFDTRGI
jgi:hypothetical protein